MPVQLSILTQESLAEELLDQEPSADFEIVLGRRQLASVLFVATVTIAVVSSIAYLAGKSLAPAPKIIHEPVQVTVPAAAIVQPVPPATTSRKEPAEGPLFGEPVNGALYLQMGAVEKGMAVIFAEGLRKRGFPAFVGTGPNDHIFRVLIGPLDSEGYRRNKEAVDQIGLNSFVRKYQQ